MTDSDIQQWDAELALAPFREMLADAVAQREPVRQPQTVPERSPKRSLTIPQGDLALPDVNVPTLGTGVKKLQTHFLRRDASGLAEYVWFSVEHFHQAQKWLMGMLAAKQSGLPVEFFRDAVVDIFHYDRAACATAVNNAGQPMRNEDIPGSIRDPKSGTQYDLVRKPFEWTRDVPSRVTDAVAEFVSQTPPDKFWIADYVKSARTFDPIIFASFGPWQVEVARWI